MKAMENNTDIDLHPNDECCIFDEEDTISKRKTIHAVVASSSSGHLVMQNDTQRSCVVFVVQNFCTRNEKKSYMYCN